MPPTIYTPIDTTLDGSQCEPVIVCHELSIGFRDIDDDVASDGDIDSDDDGDSDDDVASDGDIDSDDDGDSDDDVASDGDIDSENDGDSDDDVASQ